MYVLWIALRLNIAMTIQIYTSASENQCGDCEMVAAYTSCKLDIALVMTGEEQSS